MEAHKGTPFAHSADVNAISRRGDDSQLELLLSMLIAFSLKSPRAAEAATKITSLPQNIRDLLPRPPTQSVAPDIATDSLTRIQADISSLKEEIAKLRASMSLHNEQEIANANAELFAEEIRNQTKAQRLQALIDLENHNATLRKQHQDLTSQCTELEEALAAEERRGIDYSLLTARLEDLSRDPQLQAAERLLNEKKEWKRVLRRLIAQRQGLQARFDAKQALTAMNERKAFLAQLQEVNQKRKQRAEMNLLLVQRKMRQEFFQAEMRSFI
jgi:hypothetical protein